MLATRLRAVRARMAGAAAAAGRPAAALTLVAVSKGQPLDLLIEAYDLGVRDFGENRVQALSERAALLAASGRRPRWYLIGQVQRNKAAAAAQADWVHSVDRLPLAQALAERRSSSLPLAVLIQVDLTPGGAAAAGRGGLPPAGVLPLARAIAQLPQLRLVGLMTVAPLGLAPEPSFAALAACLRALREESAGAHAEHLSMGMSADFVPAIAAGATLIRIGRDLFGARMPPPAREEKP